MRQLNIPIFQMEGFEGDDVIGTLARQGLKENDLETVIVTGDKDALQLVEDEKILVYVPGRGKILSKIYDEATVEAKMGWNRSR